MLGVREQLGHKRRCISQPSGWGAGGRAAHLPCPHRTHHHAADTAGPPGPGLSLWDLSPCVKALEPPAPR